MSLAGVADFLRVYLLFLEKIIQKSRCYPALMERRLNLTRLEHLYCYLCYHHYHHRHLLQLAALVA